MANVKITELTELAAVDLAENDVLPIVDVGSDATKKVTIVSLRDHASANDFITYTLLNANVNTVQDNVATNATNINTVQDNVTVNLASINLVQDNVATNVTNINTVQDNVNIVQDNVAVNVASINTVQDNVNIVQDNVAASEANIISYATQANTNLDTKANVSATYFLALANDFATYTQINANLDIVQDNVASVTTSSAAVETRRAANIAGAISTVTTNDLGTAKALVSDDSGKIAVSTVSTTTLQFLDATSSVQTQIDEKAPLASPTFSGLVTAGHDVVVTGNLTVNGETTTVNSENKVIQDRFIMLANSVSGAPSGDVGIFLNRGTSGNAAIYYDESAKSFTLSETRDPDSNTVIAPTGAANLVVGEFSASTISYNGADLNTSITDNVSTLSTEATAIEARRVANIAGAVSTITTGNLTADRAMISTAGGKAGISAVTSTEIGYLDGVTSAIQTQIDSKQASLAGATLDLGTL